MSLRYKGAILSATPPTTTGGSSGTAPGMWTPQQQLQAQAANAWPSQPVPAYVEDVFNVWTYYGDLAFPSRTIQNGVNMSNGGMVWTKLYSSTTNHALFDSLRGNYYLSTNNSSGPQPESGVIGYNSNGYTMGVSSVINPSGFPMVSYSFAKKAKFFDLVTYTGNGTTQNIAHSLGSVPGYIIVKRNDSTNGDWTIYHRSTGGTNGWFFNTVYLMTTSSMYWNNTNPTDSVFTVGNGATVNANGVPYVAYLFAHNAGGFGASGTENVITCSSFTSTGSGTQFINLGYEPQFFLLNHTNSGYWAMYDRGRWFTSYGGYLGYQYPGLTNAQGGAANLFNVTATGIDLGTYNSSAAGNVYVYVAIRRGPMRTPTDATKVFNPYSGNSGSGTKITTPYFDMQLLGKRTSTDAINWSINDRLRQVSIYPPNNQNQFSLVTSSSAAEATGGNQTNYWNSESFLVPSDLSYIPYIFYNFVRAPGFFEQVNYKGTGVARTIAHNLGVAPELMIVKPRTTAPDSNDWKVYTASEGVQKELLLNSTSAVLGPYSPGSWGGSSPTATTFSVSGSGWGVNASGITYVNYLFATCPGVSKVGSYTGTGTLTTINCGFTGGARFVLIKRTDTTSDWFVWDTARGMVAGTDPSLRLNSTAAESNANSVYTIATGFQLLASPSADVNTNGGTYIYLAIA